MQKNSIQNLLYPHNPTKKNKKRKYARFLVILKCFQFHIPFSKDLEQMEIYTKFTKQVLTTKRGYTNEDTIQLDSSCSTIIKKWTKWRHP